MTRSVSTMHDMVYTNLGLINSKEKRACNSNIVLYYSIYLTKFKPAAERYYF